jgi:hypothetical protein
MVQQGIDQANDSIHRVAAGDLERGGKLDQED